MSSRLTKTENKIGDAQYVNIHYTIQFTIIIVTFISVWEVATHVRDLTVTHNFVKSGDS